MTSVGGSTVSLEDTACLMGAYDILAANFTSIVDS